MQIEWPAAGGPNSLEATVNPFILIATLVLADNRTLQLYDHSANCAYPQKAGVVINSANQPLFDICWRVATDEGRVLTTYSANLLVEQMDWTPAGRQYLRSVTR